MGRGLRRRATAGRCPATSTTTTAPRTRATPHELFRLLEEEVAPEFYQRGGDGIPRDWVARVRRSLRTLGPEFGAGRMLEDYEKKVYKTGL